MRSSVEVQGKAPEADDLAAFLHAIPEDPALYGPWWATAVGREFYRILTERIGRPVSASVNRLYGVDYEPADVANTAVTMLCQDVLPRYILKAEQPWAYLAGTLKRELIHAAGAHFREDLTDESALPVTDGMMRPAMTISEAVDLTVAVLNVEAPAPGLHTVVSYLADRGSSRISHVYSQAAADPELQAGGLTRNEILAVANAVLGSRRGGASVIAGFLTDPAFNPQTSLPHQRALKKYRTRMERTTHEQETLVG